MLPGGIGAPLKAALEHGGGVTTGGYSPVFYGELKKYYIQAEEVRDLNDQAEIMKEVAVNNDRVHGGMINRKSMYHSIRA